MQPNDHKSRRDARRWSLVLALLALAGVGAWWFAGHEADNLGQHADGQGAATAGGAPTSRSSGTDSHKSHNVQGKDQGKHRGATVEHRATHATDDPSAHHERPAQGNATDGDKAEHGVPHHEGETGEQNPVDNDLEAQKTEDDRVMLRLSGVVISEDKRPVPGAVVHLLVRIYPWKETEKGREVNPTPHVRELLRTTTTSDQNGQFHIEERVLNAFVYICTLHTGDESSGTIPFATYETSFSREDSTPTSFSETDIRLMVSLPVQIRCKVTNQQGATVAGATCFWIAGRYTSLARFSGDPIQSITDADGVAHMYVPKRHNYVAAYTVYVVASGYATEVSPLIHTETLAQNRVLEISIVVFPGRDVRVRLVNADEGGAPLRDMQVAVMMRGGAQAPYLYAICSPGVVDNLSRTDSEGDLVLKSLPLEEVRLIMSDSDFVEKVPSPTIPAGQDDVTIEMVSRKHMLLTYVSADTLTPLSLASIHVETVWPADKDGNARPTQKYARYAHTSRLTNPYGLSSYANVRIDITVYMEGRVEPFRHSISTSASEPILREETIPVPAPSGGVTVHGRTLDPEGRGVEGIAVLLREAAADPEKPGPAADITSGKDGAFVIHNVPAGEYMLTAKSTEQYLGSSQQLEVSQNDLYNITLTLAYAARLMVLYPHEPEGVTWRYVVWVKDANGTRSRFADDDQMEEARRWKLTHSSFNVKPGKVSVALATDAFLFNAWDDPTCVRSIECAEGKSTPFVLREPLRTVRISGTIRDTNGTPYVATGFQITRVEAHATDSPIAEGHTRINALRTDPSGFFLRSGLIPGRYICRRITKEGQGSPVIIDVSEFAEQTIDLTVP